MKGIVSIIALLAALIFNNVANAQSKLDIYVTNIKDIQGHILVSVSDSEKEFMKQSTYSKKVKVNKNSMVISFSDIPEGQYAVSLFHDKNDNNKLDSNFLGIPKEKYGFSNNASSKFGPPPFIDCLFKKEGDTRIDIKLK